VSRHRAAAVRGRRGAPGTHRRETERTFGRVSGSFGLLRQVARQHLTPRPTAADPAQATRGLLSALAAVSRCRPGLSPHESRRHRKDRRLVEGADSAPTTVDRAVENAELAQAAQFGRGIFACRSARQCGEQTSLRASFHAGAGGSGSRLKSRVNAASPEPCARRPCSAIRPQRCRPA